MSPQTTERVLARCPLCGGAIIRTRIVKQQDEVIVRLRDGGQCEVLRSRESWAPDETLGSMSSYQCERGHSTDAMLGHLLWE